VLARHPLFTATVETDRRGRLRWSAASNPTPNIEWETGATGEPMPRRTRLDLRQEIGIRFFVRRDGTRSDLTIQFHHSCCDGAGFELFLKELLVSYARECGNSPQGSS
jgi:hypothetical protein